MAKIPWTISIDPRVKDATDAYVKGEAKDSASAVISELLKTALKRAGYWPPKEKAGE